MENKTVVAILKQLGIASLNKMQEASLKAHETHSEVLLLSPTGTGKTLAFLLPLLKRLKPGLKEVQAIIVAPSRELVMQIDEVLKSLKSEFFSTAFYGGHLMKGERNSLGNFPSVIITTPGRFVDHLDKETFNSEAVHSIIFDEFDKSLEFGFHDQMSYILKKLPTTRYKSFTSATDGVRIPDFVGTSSLVKLNFIDDNTNDRLTLNLVTSKEKDKLHTILKLICTIKTGQMIVFCNHRDACDRVYQYLYDAGIFCEVFHGGKDQKDREFAFMKLKNGSIQVLVATDLAARGLDVPDIAHVIHYHLPHKREEFVHRNGRTARVEATGQAYILNGPTEEIPTYLKNDTLIPIALSETITLLPEPAFKTIFIGGGKQSKINKVDVVGFLSKKGGLERGELGLVIVKDNVSYAAIATDKVEQLLNSVAGEKIKGKKLKTGLA